MNHPAAPWAAAPPPPPPPPPPTEDELKRRRYVGEAEQQLQEIQEILDTLTNLVASTENMLVTLRSRGAQYAESMHFARPKRGDAVAPWASGVNAPAFSNSTAREKLEKLVRDVQVAHRELSGINAELLRFGK